MSKHVSTIYNNVPAGAFDWGAFPDFIVGNIAYDQSMPAVANKHGVTMVDATDTIHAFHQTGPEGNAAGHVRNKAPKDHNWRLWETSGA